ISEVPNYMLPEQASRFIYDIDQALMRSTDCPTPGWTRSGPRPVGRPRSSTRAPSRSSWEARRSARWTTWSPPSRPGSSRPPRTPSRPAARPPRWSPSSPRPAVWWPSRKVATTGAALESGVVGPDEMVPCPASISVSGRTIPNDDDFALGTVPLETAFARSCNTSQAAISDRLEPEAMKETAAKLGLGVDFVTPGLTTYTGAVP